MFSGASRRAVLKSAVSTALLPALISAKDNTANKWTPGTGMPVEGPDTPKICAPVSRRELSEKAMREVKQIGVNYVLTGGPRIPWEAADLQAFVDKLKSGGLTLGNMMIAGFPNTLYGRPGRDEEIENVKASIRAAGKVGLPVVEYNFYAHRAIEGYYEQDGRGGAGLTAFDANRVKNLPPLAEEGAHTLEEMWNNISYFLKAVIPVAEQSNVRSRCIRTIRRSQSVAVQDRLWARLRVGSI